MTNCIPPPSLIYLQWTRSKYVDKYTVIVSSLMNSREYCFYLPTFSGPEMTFQRNNPSPSTTILVQQQVSPLTRTVLLSPDSFGSLSSQIKENPSPLTLSSEFYSVKNSTQIFLLPLKVSTFPVQKVLLPSRTSFLGPTTSGCTSLRPVFPSVRQSSLHNPVSTFSLTPVFLQGLEKFSQNKGSRRTHSPSLYYNKTYNPRLKVSPSLNTNKFLFGITLKYLY